MAKAPDVTHGEMVTYFEDRLDEFRKELIGAGVNLAGEAPEVPEKDADVQQA